MKPSAVIETGSSVPMAKVRIRVRGGRDVSIGDLVRILDDPFPGQQATGRIVGINHARGRRGLKDRHRLPDGSTITRYSRMTRWGA